MVEFGGTCICFGDFTMKMRLLLALAFAFTSSTSCFAAQKKQSAADLIQNAREGVVLIGQGLKESKTDTKSKTVAPFVKTLKEVDSSLKKASEQVKAKDKGANKTIADAAKSARTLEVTFSRSGIKDAKVKQGVSAVNDSVLLVTRSVLGGGVEKASKQDKAAFDKSKGEYAKLQEKQKEMDKQLTALKSKLAADPKADPALVKTVEKMQRESKLVSSSPYSADSFVDALLLVADIAGLFDGWSYYVSPAYASQWNALDSLTNYSNGWMNDVWVVVPYDVTYYTETFDVPADLYEVQMSPADMVTYDTYLATSYNDVDWGPSSQEVGHFSDVDVSSSDMSYLQDETIDVAMQDEEDTEETTESLTEDSDHDGVADAQDTDDDNDGVSDGDEAAANVGQDDEDEDEAADSQEEDSHDEASAADEGGDGEE